MAGTSQQTGQTTMGQTASTARTGMTQQTGSAGSEFMRRTQSMIGGAVDRGKGVVADRVEHYTNLAREVGDILRDRGEPQAADLVQTLAARTQGMSRYLRNTDSTRLWTDIQEAARGRTWLLTGIGLVSGLALARTVRTAADYNSGASDEYRERYSQHEGRYPESPYAEQYSQ